MSNIEVETNGINNERTMIALIGHRCLQQYSIENYLQQIAEEYPDAEWVLNGSLGVGLQASQFAFEHDIPYTLVLPFPPKLFTRKWSEEHRMTLEDAARLCRRLSVLQPVYGLLAYSRANRRMVDMSDGLIAFADPVHISPRNEHSEKPAKECGRTAQTINYAAEAGVPCFVIDIRGIIEAFGKGEFIRYGKHQGRVVRILGEVR